MRTPFTNRKFAAMTVEGARKETLQAIVHIYDTNEAANIAEIALEYVTGLRRTERALKKYISLSQEQEQSLSQIIVRLRTHEPIQYITNVAWFGGMKFYVDKNVLIPRPETEELVDWIIKEVKIQGSSPKIVDIGTGSGCMAIALKSNLPHAEVWACDVSDEALTVARLNADTLQATIDFVPLNFLDKEQRKQLPHVDIIASNPPYVPRQNQEELPKNVVDFEPSVALFVPDDDPLSFYNAIADFGKEKLKKGGLVYVEIHESFGGQVKELFQSKGYSSVQLKQDMQGKDRMLKAGIIDDY